MKFSVYAFVAVLAATVAAEAVAEPDMDLDFLDFEEFDLEDALEERAIAKGNPSKCNKYAKMIPSCARGPIKACQKKNGCSPLDYKCGCSKKAAVTKCARTKVINACGIQKAQAAQAATNKVCKCAK